MFGLEFFGITKHPDQGFYMKSKHELFSGEIGDDLYKNLCCFDPSKRNQRTDVLWKILAFML